MNPQLPAASIDAVTSGLAAAGYIASRQIATAVYLAERITMLHEGRVVQTGTYRELLLQPANAFVGQFINAQRTLPDASEIT